MQNRLSCIYHTSELITNFCQDKTCLMPLCPACISEHTCYHEDQETRPLYCSINQIIANTYAQIDNCIQSLKRDQNRNFQGELIIQINLVEQQVKDKINGLKDSVYRIIQQSFGQLQRDILRRLQKWHEQKKIFCLQLSQKNDRILIEQLSELDNLRDGLKHNRVLSNIIYFYREKQKDVNDLHSQISVYLHNNENYSPKIQINSQALHSISAILGRSVKVNSENFLVDEKIKNQMKNSRLSPSKSNIVYQYHNNPEPSLNNKSKFRDKDYRAQKIEQNQKTKLTNNAPFSGGNPSSSILSRSQTNLAYKFQKSRNSNSINRDTQKKSGYLNSVVQSTPFNRIHNQNYENITKKVLQMRSENQRLSRYLKPHLYE